MVYKVLIINPNSSKKVTDNLTKILIEPLEVKFSFYTAPTTAPAEITGESTSILSEQVVLPDLVSKGLVEQYDGFLICCYSDHPLIHSLGKVTDKPILGIMQATLLYSLSNPFITKSFILTSVNEWEPLLDQGIIDFVGNENNQFPSKKFERTKGLDVSVLSLSNPEEYQKIYNRVDSILNDEYKDSGINCVLLGCAGMAGLDEKLTQSFKGIQFIDSVKVGVELLAALIRFNEHR
ncbi:Asp/Glu/hydantoin racemase [Scheffersomyces coipomensis]|uniref:Asp/Glu/hydantoin racemase n=1 Tax=Scheffersomyces coipomensis TaxID=1788519 RepID=UPI00315D9693